MLYLTDDELASINGGSLIISCPSYTIFIKVYRFVVNLFLGK